MPVVAALYHLALAFWIGGVTLFTFVLTPAIFKTGPRDLAARTVGILFPGYFRWGLACGVAALLLRLALRHPFLDPALVLLPVLLLCVAVQTFFIEPRAAALKKEIPSFETTPKDHPLRRRFSRLHALSAICNLVVFVGGVALILLG
jgi:hypothetical protein